MTDRETDSVRMFHACNNLISLSNFMEDSSPQYSTQIRKEAHVMSEMLVKYVMRYPEEAN